MENKIIEWLEKSGYPLELSAIEILRKYHYSPYSSGLYQDYETQKIREIDIIANNTFDQDGVHIEFKLIIECKKSSKPFIILAQNDNTTFIDKVFYNIEVDHPIAHSALETASNLRKNKFKNHFKWTKYPIGFKMVQGLTDSDDMIYTAVNAVSKSYKYFYEFEKKIYDVNVKDNYYSLAIPILLIDAPLYKSSLSKTNGIQIEKLDVAFITVKKPWEFESDTNYDTPVVTLSAFGDFVNELNYLMKFYLANILALPVKYQIKNMFKEKQRKYKKSYIKVSKKYIT